MNESADTAHGSAASTGKAEFSVTMRTMELVVAAIILLFGLAFLYSSYKLGFRWGRSGPESGFFPFYISLFISLASISVIVQTLMAKDPRKLDKAFILGGQLKQVLAVLIPSIIYVLGIQLIGIYVSSIIYIALFMRFIGHYSWVKSVVMALAVVIAFFLMFEVWFKVQLFKGMWDLTGWTGY